MEQTASLLRFLHFVTAWIKVEVMQEARQSGRWPDRSRSSAYRYASLEISNDKEL